VERRFQRYRSGNEEAGVKASGRRSLVIVAAVALAVPAVVSASGSTPAAAQGRFRGQGLAPVERISVAKSTSGRLAQTDPALLDRTDGAAVPVVVKLDYDAAARYQGDVKGLAATSPKVTGRALDGRSAAEQAYEAYTTSMESTFVAALHQAVPAARVGVSLRQVYGGVAVSLPANQVAKLLSLPGVAAVQPDALEHPLTDASPGFIGAPTIWDQEGGQAVAGKGVIFGSLDTGIWPEHPSFADDGSLGPPPAKADGTPRDCAFGDNPLTPADDPFTCNNKLIGGQPFLETYNQAVGGEMYPDSARDSDGHGTHTASTAAGDPGVAADPLGIDRGQISGIAPAAWVISYKVCGAQGCFSSDSVDAVQQAILDGVNVINFSIGGGANPTTDPVELAFLDAYDAGVFVAASAGNDGPGAGTTEHQGPWVTTVAASTQARAFESTLTLTAADGATATLTGASLTPGIPTALPVVLSSAAPYDDDFCANPAPAGLFTGKIVACKRGNGVARVLKGFNVLQGGAAGMILYNPTLQDTETDNHFLPTVHLADGADFLAFVGAHTDVTASFTQGEKVDGQGDVMAAFSSRGPGTQFLKPDVTAPGVQILAGASPTPDAVELGPAGNYFQAIAGTSMSSPHVAGSALLLKALHPTWTPATIKSALETTATTSVVKEDTKTPADPFDMGGGRIDLTKAGDAALSFEETADRFAELAGSPADAVELNLPSVDVPTMPGTVTVTRTVTNVSDHTMLYVTSATAPEGTTIRVSPRFVVVRAGETADFDVHITAAVGATAQQYFGQVELEPLFSPAPIQHLPVAFVTKQGGVSLTQSCDPASVAVGASATCAVTVANNTFSDADVHPTTSVDEHLEITGADGADVHNGVASPGQVTLPKKVDGDPQPGEGDSPAAGEYLPLAGFGVPATAVGDETIVNYDVPAFVYHDTTYTRIGVTSDGYLVAGGGGASDVQFMPQHMPDPAAPNNVLAPFWTDLNGEQGANGGGDGIRVGDLTDGTSHWIVVEWDLAIFGAPDDVRSFQVWLGVNGTEDISYVWNQTLAPAPEASGLSIGAENSGGLGGFTLDTLPDASSGYAAQRVQSTPSTPGGALTYHVTAQGELPGPGQVTTRMVAPGVPGTYVVRSDVAVT
jgi:subtilisin family serine protease